MSDFSVRADSVNVEEIMRQIRARVKEKRGADYTEEEIKALASVKLEKFLDPLAVRSGLLDEYRNAKSVTTLADIEPAPDLYGFDEESIYASSRGGALRSIRKLLNPILKLFFNPNPLIRVLNMQAALNGYFTRSIARVGSREALNFEVLHNVVVELTRLSIENRNLKMRVESLNTRLDFAERRARALEGVVQYKTGASAVSLTTLEPVADASLAPEDADKAGRRRRRRRGRRRGPGEGGEGMEGGEGQGADSSRGEGQATESHTHAAGNDGPDSPQS
ncbi:hypothetical protein [Luteitalea sp.]|jgi:hypothetical protein|uniref:hypothetical protein n=1 Tax=Luteitalea sp. TaxID=2004800 RepID=UPI0037C85FE7